MIWLTLLLAAAAAAAAVYVLRIAPIGCAYKAKALCSAIFVSGRDFAAARDPDVSADAYRIMRAFWTSVDREARAVTCSFLGLRRRTAAFKPGFGAALTIDGVDRRAAAIGAGRPASAEERARPWPTGEAAAPRRELDALLAAQFTEPNPRRLRRTRAVVAVRDGELVGERYAPGFDGDMPLPGWSMTKSVMATLIGARIRDGALALSDDKLLPEWSGPGDPRARIRLEDLLRMRSGLGFSEVYHDPLSDVTRMIFGEVDAGLFALRRPLAHDPGMHWQYASGTSNILSRILRRTFADDAAYWHYPRRRLFDPVGMRSAVLETDASGHFVASSFMFAAARDWARLGQLMLQDGVWEGTALLPEGWREFCARETPQSPGGRYGAHWWRRLQPEFGGESAAAARIPEDAFFALGHEGQTVAVIPSRRVVLVRLGMSIYIDAWNQAEFTASFLDAL